MIRPIPYTKEEMLITGVSTLCSAVFFLVATFAFSLRSPDSSSEVTKRLPKVVFLPLGVPPVNRMHGELQAWVELHDPTILSLPNEEHGFSCIRRYEFERPMHLQPDPELNATPSAPVQLPPLRLGIPVGDPLTALEQAHRTVAPRLSPPPPVPTIAPGAYWTGPDGTPLTWLMLPTPAKLPNPPPKIYGPTRLAVHAGLADTMRIRIITSSGSPFLDQQALRLLSRTFLPGNKNVPASLRRSLKQGKTSIFLAQWRFLPGIDWQKEAVSANSRITEKEKWNDLDWF